MNKYLTYCAQAKLKQLIDESGAQAIDIKALPQGSIGFELVYPVKESIGFCKTAIILSETPKVYTDLFTLSQLSNASVDFDYPASEFVIKREQRVISTNVG